MLKLDNVSVSYGSFKALENVSLYAEQGELVVLLGSNGAGKSTLFKAVSGLVKVQEGSMEAAGTSILGKPPSFMVKKGIVQCAEGRMLFPAMTVLENLKMGSYVHRRDKKVQEEQLRNVYDLFPILQEKRKDPAGSLSGGQQQMVAIGRALMAKPSLLLLDEPSLGLAPLIVEQMFETISEINKTGVTVLLAEQNAHAALKISNRGYVLENGSVVMEGTQKELMNNEDIRKAYIGA
ncbi:ABC transporter ATP-binding protein [Thalassorhabdus alkalitolerans]|uniref:ABC transporter ATP-binding protein n=1 Tax=Thalassorhabdus alkalitolerans TaxID=2282697 RepID=A0ABW0YLM0_9BACI|nr:ABC transporter ATP-binding protein [Thalassobacillus sp. C254]